MKTIHKQVLEVTGTQKIKLSNKATILSVANQKDNLCIWYMCEESDELEEITIHIFGTGFRIWPSFNGQFLGTVLMAKDNLVWHVFKEI